MCLLCLSTNTMTKKVLLTIMLIERDAKHVIQIEFMANVMKRREKAMSVEMFIMQIVKHDQHGFNVLQHIGKHNVIGKVEIVRHLKKTATQIQQTSMNVFRVIQIGEGCSAL